ncbi:hypothetical protein IMSAG013_00659 [Clostridiales bacterium]|nr:hypothetical protein [Clostridiales bacterium]GFI55611.1 hypothetical protein IMSAG013_00659 [Clostridiales bacterium]
MAKALKSTSGMEEETRTVFIPRKNKNDTERYVAVNGENMLIQTGRNVEVPLRYAEVIENSLRQDAAAEAFIEAYANG